jgi:hypothetical protein
VRKIRCSSVAQAGVAIALVLFSLPIAAKAWTRCFLDGTCRTCFFCSDDGRDTYQGYMSGCAPAA